MAQWGTTARGKRADPDPNPGIGGYRHPRGPYGATGFPGSTAWTRENPQAAADKLHNARMRPAMAPPFGRRYDIRRFPTIEEQQANQIPWPARQGGLPYRGPHSNVNPNRVRDTECRPRIVLSAGGKGGGESQRNTKYYGGLKAQPGQDITILSASKGRHFPITEVTVPNRYTFGGVNGGTDNTDDGLAARRMPYTGQDGFRVPGGRPGTIGGLGHARGSVRGAVLDGTRLKLAPVIPDTAVSKQGGGYGRRIRGTQRHRPTVFVEPAPWTGKFYDTTAEVGSPDKPPRNAQIKESVHISPTTPARRGRWGVRHYAR